ncbi:MAG: GNAT family N-acetyltransferase [Candidatus Lokiarchaeota archaeon]|nr:GNAT family N-acetyltransferase [Candidatus Lokiarchaeota archaeon]
MSRNYVYRKMYLDLRTIPSEMRAILLRNIGYKKKLTEIRDFNIEKDWAKLVFIMNKAFEDTPDFFDEDEGTLLSIESKKKFFEMKIFFAMKKNVEIGFIAILPKTDQYGKKKATISLLAVIPEFRRQKIGSILAICSYDWLINEGIYDLFALVGEDNIPSYNFMRSLGFKEYDREIIKGNSC